MYGHAAPHMCVFDNKLFLTTNYLLWENKANDIVNDDGENKNRMIVALGF